MSHFFLGLAIALSLLGCGRANTPVEYTENKQVNISLGGTPTKYATGYIKTHSGHGLVEGAPFKSAPPVYSLPESFDWRAIGVDLPVKNQGSCGSCWSFSTVANLESLSVIFNKKELQFSEQEIVDCDNRWYGCNGGNFAGPYLTKYGLALESDYPYEARTMKCRRAGKPRAIKPISFYNLGNGNSSPKVDEMKAAILHYGYLSVAVGANSRWDKYKGGVMKGCGFKGVNHMVNLVGWDNKGNWIMRNSWGTKWGDKGYALMPFGCDRIGVEAAYSILEEE
jgi:C1A family cysteine protease